MKAIFDQICSSTQFLGQESGGMTVKPCGIPVDRIVPFDKVTSILCYIGQEGNGSRFQRGVSLQAEAVFEQICSDSFLVESYVMRQ